MTEIEMQDKTKPAPLPFDPTKHLLLLQFMKKKLTNIFHILKKWRKYEMVERALDLTLGECCNWNDSRNLFSVIAEFRL